jgi:diadenosine tetraphosphate (Ap4A) HIT family hydrolase
MQLPINGDDCALCKMVLQTEGLPVVYSNEHVLAVVDPAGKATCHIQVIPHQHAGALLDLQPEIATNVTYVVALINMAISNVTDADGLIVLPMDAESAYKGNAQHFHLHLIPHYSGDAQDAWIHEEELPDYITPEQISLVARRLQYHLNQITSDDSSDDSPR